MYECVYATTSVALQVLGYPDTEPTALMNLVHPGGHVGGEDYGVVATFLRDHPERWAGLPPIVLVNPADTLAYLRDALAKGYAVQLDVKDDRSGNVMAQWPAGWQGTHSVIVVGDAPITIWNPWAGDRHSYSDDFFRQATLNPAGNFMVFQRDIRIGGKMPDQLPAGWRSEALGGQWTQVAAPVVLADGSLHIFGIGTDGKLWHLIYKAA